jgi:threonine/homoserine/homoserine lactone efflux protein
MAGAMITQYFLPFLLTALLIELTPGPNMAWLAVTGASVGRRAALSATAGIGLGLAIVGLAAAFGLAELLQSSPNLFAALRYAGVAYLFWLAWSAWVGAKDVSPEQLSDGGMHLWFRHGLFLNLLNPKAAVFFVAIVPNYIDVRQPIMPQTLLLSSCYVAIATLIHLALALLSGRAHKRFQNERRAVLIRRLCAGSIAAVAIWFLFSSAGE